MMSLKWRPLCQTPTPDAHKARAAKAAREEQTKGLFRQSKSSDQADSLARAHEFPNHRQDFCGSWRALRDMRLDRRRPRARQ